ncbi:MAG: LysR family transcriptional regulator [Subtercola sp.]|jgi:DNA-binding transcriptional LysR family regulator|nr:LysR family transcriptional regulator [Subtercola sp.]
MELRHLRHFVSLAEERNFTRAAAKEFIVQSGLSSSIRALENELGAPLFVRGTRPVRLTAEGEALLPAAHRALDAVDVAHRVVQEAHGALTGTLRIGSLRSDGHTLPFTSWLADFSREHPGIDIRVEQFAALRTLAMVASGELDCALTSVVPDHAIGLEVVPLISEPIVLACAPDDPLGSFASVTLDQLDGRRFVDPHPEWAIRVLIDETFRQAGLTRRIVAEADEWAMVLDLVAEGIGIAMVPSGLKFGRHQPPRESLKLVPITGIRLERRIDFVLPRGQTASPAARQFLDHVNGRL